MTQSTDQITTPMTDTFGSLAVGPSIGRAIRSMGYSTPTPIQEQAIPPLREGHDVMGQAQTGTGKTAGFGIPLLEKVDIRRREVQAIVLVPTRELCLQVADELTRLGQYSNLHVLPVYGGVGFSRQLGGLKHAAHVVVGTPGRVEDLIQRGALDLRSVRLAILDEADRMLDVGFLPAIERILRRTPVDRQTALFSATIPEAIRGLANRQMRNPVLVTVNPEQQPVDLIEQRIQRVPDGNKLEALRVHLNDPSCFMALVFRRTTYKADRLARDLARLGYPVAVLHGRRSQNQRERALNDMRAGKVQVLVATDIAARGLDISGLTHVFNYDLPDTSETYVHRVGRTGRAGETGIAITLVAPEDEQEMRSIENGLAPRKQARISSVKRTPATAPGTPSAAVRRENKPARPASAAGQNGSKPGTVGRREPGYTQGRHEASRAHGRSHSDRRRHGREDVA